MPIPTEAAARPRLLLRDHAFQALHRAILDSTLVPGGRLADDALAEWLGVARASLRVALGRLSCDGLVRVEANRSARVAIRDATVYGHVVGFVRAPKHLAHARATGQRRAAW